MPSSGQIFGAAILKALGKGAEGAADVYSKKVENDKKTALEKAKIEREYALKQLDPTTTERELKAYNKLTTPEEKANFLNIKAAGTYPWKAGSSGPTRETPVPRALSNEEAYSGAARRVESALKSGKTPSAADWGIVKKYEGQ